MKKGYVIDQDEIEDIIIYRDANTNSYHFYVLYTEGSVKEIAGKDGLNFFTQYLNETGYKKINSVDGTIAGNSKIHICKTEEEAKKLKDELSVNQIAKRVDQAILETKNNHFIKRFMGLALHKKSDPKTITVKPKKKRNGISNLKYNHKKMYKIVIAGVCVVVAGSIASIAGYHLAYNGKDKKKETTTTNADSMKQKNANKKTKTVLATFFEQAMEKANALQKPFLESSVKATTYFNQNFSTNHEERNVVFPDGHQVSLVHFGLSPQSMAAAYILGASFSPDAYQSFMNASDISIEEYKDYYNAWYTQMFYAYAVRGGQEETGLLDIVSNEEGKQVLKEIDDLHKQLRTARNQENQEAQQKALESLYQLKNRIFKIEEAYTLEPTYENFQKLALPDYVLLAKPIFDEVAHEYRNWTVENGKRFYDEREQKVFQEGGIYCHLYEWTMKENVESQKAKLSAINYQADESYLDYDTALYAVIEKLKEQGAYISYCDQKKEEYDVEHLRAVDAAFNWTTYKLQEKTSTSYKSSGKSSSKKTSTRTETIVEKKEVTQETVSKESLSETERQEATRQEEQINASYREETERAKEEAERQAEEMRKQDQAKEDAKKEQLEQEVQRENEKKKEEIEQMQPGNGVSDPTTDGSDAYQPFPDLNQDESNEQWSDQKDTIIEGEEEYIEPSSISYQANQTASYEMLAEQIVTELSNEGIDVTIEQPIQYTKGR